MNEIHIDGVTFNVASVQKLTERQFVEHPMHNHHYTHLKVDKKKALLKTVYRTIKKIT